MKRFARNASFFLIGLLLISYIIQSFVFALIKNLEVGELGVINKIIEGKINSDILICGASRSFVGINPKIIEEQSGMSSYNISLNGSRLGIQVPLLKTYLKHNKNPKILIQELGMYSLALDEKIYAPYKFIPHLDEPDIYEGLKKIDSYLWINKYVPLANLTYFNTNLQKILINDYKIQISNLEDNLINGFHPNQEKWNIDEEQFLKNPIGVYDKIQPKGIELLEELIEICKTNNIRLIFVNTPEYYKILPLYKNRDNVINIFKEKTVQNNLEYFDYTEHEITKDKNIFYNFTHLNSLGADIFTKILSDNIFKNN